MRWFRKGGAISDADSVCLSRNIVGGLRRKPCKEDLAACGRPTAQGGGFEADLLSSGPTVVLLGLSGRFSSAFGQFSEPSWAVLDAG
eukprot:656811-Pyramimonas_sp.AAC.1